MAPLGLLAQQEGQLQVAVWEGQVVILVPVRLVSALQALAPVGVSAYQVR